MNTPTSVDGMIFWQQRLADIFVTRDAEAKADNLANSLFIRSQCLADVVNTPQFRTQPVIHLGELFSFISATATWYKFELNTLVEEFLLGYYTDLLPLRDPEGLRSVPAKGQPELIQRSKLADCKPRTVAGYELAVRKFCQNEVSLGIQNHLFSLCEKTAIVAEKVDIMSGYFSIEKPVSEDDSLFEDYMLLKKSLVQALVHWFGIVSFLRLGADYILEYVFDKGCRSCGRSLCSCRIDLFAKECTSSVERTPQTENEEDELDLWLATV